MTFTCNKIYLHCDILLLLLKRYPVEFVKVMFTFIVTNQNAVCGICVRHLFWPVKKRHCSLHQQHLSVTKSNTKSGPFTSSSLRVCCYVFVDSCVLEHQVPSCISFTYAYSQVSSVQSQPAHFILWDTKNHHLSAQV